LLVNRTLLSARDPMPPYLPRFKHSLDERVRNPWLSGRRPVPVRRRPLPRFRSASRR
jgi:hypothetical protein